MSLVNFHNKPKSTGSLIFRSVFPVLILVLGSLLFYFFTLQSQIIEKTQDSLKETVSKGTMLLIKNFDLSLRLSEEKIEKTLNEKAIFLQNRLNKLNPEQFEAFLINYSKNDAIDWYILSDKLIVTNSSIKSEIDFDLGKAAGPSLIACIDQTNKTKMPTSGRSSLEKSSNKAKKYVYISLKNNLILELGQYLPDTDLIQAQLVESINKIDKKFKQVTLLQLYYGEGLKRSINKTDFILPEVDKVSSIALKSGKEVKQRIGDNIHIFKQIRMDHSNFNEKWLMHLAFSMREKEVLLWKSIIQFLIILALTTLAIYLALKRNLKTYTTPLDELVTDTEKLLMAEKPNNVLLKHSTDIDVLKYNFNFLFDILYKNKTDLEQKVKSRTEKLESTNLALESSLKQQEMMFKEVHHRVKNNLQIISSLLNLQASQLEDTPKAYEAFQESINRVSAIGLFHEKMYKSKQLEILDLCDFLNELVSFIISGMPKTMHYKIQCNHIMVKSDNAVTIALILNELLINSNKHGYPENKVAEVSIEFLTKDNSTTLLYKDNGKGLPENFDAKKIDTLGMTIIDAFCEKLDAPFEIKNNGTQGMQFSCSFSNPLV